MVSQEKIAACSVFDSYHKLENPSGRFAWESVSATFRFREEDVICRGELQQIESSTSFSCPTRYYAALPNALIMFLVTHIKDYMNLVDKKFINSKCCSEISTTKIGTI